MFCKELLNLRQNPDSHALLTLNDMVNAFHS